MKKLTSLLLSLGVLAGTLVAFVATAPTASAICDIDRSYYSTPYKGRKVWVPTNKYSAWVGDDGARIKRSESQGKMTSSTKASKHSVTVTGKVGTKIGPVGAEVTSTYNGTWSRSTTNASSYTSRWAYSFRVPKDKNLWHARLYKQGYVYKYKQTITYLGGCKNKVRWFYSAAPVKSNNTFYYRWALESRPNFNKLRYDGL